MKKRIFAGLFTLALALSLSTLCAAAAGGAEFSDMPPQDHWSYPALTCAVENGLLRGRTAGRLEPEENLTRAEMAAIVNRAFGAFATEDISSYTDISKDAWYYGELEKAVKMRTFFGDGDRMRPGDPITRQEAFVVLGRAALLVEDQGNGNGLAKRFSDADEVDAWAKPVLCAMCDNQYIKGNENKLRPKEHITRAEFAQVLYQLVAFYYSTPGEYDTAPAGNLLLRTPGQVFRNATVDGDLIVGDGAAEGEIYLYDCDIRGRIVVRGAGVHCVKLINSTLVGGVIAVGKTYGPVHVERLPRGGTGTGVGQSLNVVAYQGSADVTVLGDFSSVRVQGDHVTLWAQEATMKQGVVDGNDSRIMVAEKSSLETGIINGDRSRIEVTGESKLGHGVLAGNDSTIHIQQGSTIETGRIQAGAENSVIIMEGAAGTGTVTIGGKPAQGDFSDGDDLKVTGDKDQDVDLNFGGGTKPPHSGAPNHTTYRLTLSIYDQSGSAEHRVDSFLSYLVPDAPLIQSVMEQVIAKRTELQKKFSSTYMRRLMDGGIDLYREGVGGTGWTEAERTAWREYVRALYEKSEGPQMPDSGAVAALLPLLENPESTISQMKEGVLYSERIRDVAPDNPDSTGGPGHGTEYHYTVTLRLDKQ